MPDAPDSEREFARIVALARLARAIAHAAAADTESALARLEELGCTTREVDEAILQGIPYSGIPGAVEALGAWRRLRPTADVPTIAPFDPTARGEEMFEAVYGAPAPRVRDELGRRHPTLEEWVIQFAYGRVMGRGVLPLADLEALGVASLLAQRRLAPLHSHLRGARRAGWEGEALHRLIDALAPECDPDTVAAAHDLIRRESGASDGRETP